MDTDRQEFYLNNLASNPNYDFISSLSDIDADSDDQFMNSPYDSSNFNCSYVDPLSFCNTYKNNGKFSIMSFNIQSLSAKFNDLY